MILFIAVEVMYFLALISAYLIISRGSVVWPPPEQPRLPIPVTSLNTVVLLLSGFMMFLSNKAYLRNNKSGALSKLTISVVLATVFLGIQGYEWSLLIYEGLTFFSSNYGSLFYLIVGSHALHAVVAIIIMFWVWFKMKRGTVSDSAFNTAQTFWYFVVGVWPFLYITVYLL